MIPTPTPPERGCCAGVVVGVLCVLAAIACVVIALIAYVTA